MDSQACSRSELNAAARNAFFPPVGSHRWTNRRVTFPPSMHAHAMLTLDYEIIKRLVSTTSFCLFNERKPRTQIRSGVLKRVTLSIVTTRNEHPSLYRCETTKVAWTRSNEWSSSGRPSGWSGFIAYRKQKRSLSLSLSVPGLLSHSLAHKNFPGTAEIREPRHLIGYVRVFRRKFVVRISMRARVH